MIGKITYFNNERGFGFIVNDESGDSAFVHISQITGTNGEHPAVGQSVSYDTRTTKKGTEAIDVKFI